MWEFEIDPGASLAPSPGIVPMEVPESFVLTKTIAVSRESDSRHLPPIDLPTCQLPFRKYSLRVGETPYPWKVCTNVFAFKICVTMEWSNPVLLHLGHVASKEPTIVHRLFLWFTITRVTTRTITWVPILLAVSFHFYVRITVYKFIVLYCSLNWSIAMFVVYKHWRHISFDIQIFQPLNNSMHCFASQ